VLRYRTLRWNISIHECSGRWSLYSLRDRSILSWIRLVVVKQPRRWRRRQRCRWSAISSFSLGNRKKPESLSVAPMKSERSHAWEDRRPAASERGYGSCSVLLNASIDVRRPGNRWRSRRSLSYRILPSSSIISIGSYLGLSNKLFAKGRECVCAFTVRALFVLLVAARRSRGTRVYCYFTLSTYMPWNLGSLCNFGEICKKKNHDYIL